MVIKTKYGNGIIFNLPDAGCSLQEIRTYIKEHINDWIDQPVLWDLRAFDFSTIKCVDVSAFLDSSKQFSAKREGCRTAIVVGSELGFGIARMISSLADGQLEFQMAVFRSEPDAINWLKEGQ